MYPCYLVADDGAGQSKILSKLVVTNGEPLHTT